MGYTTDFIGSLSITPTLTKEHLEYLITFSDIRHMKRDGNIVATFKDSRRNAVGLPVGLNGEYYVGSIDTGYSGQAHSAYKHRGFCDGLKND